MDLIYNALLFIHVSAGFTSLSLFWIPVITKKGGKVHNGTGKMYTYSMTVVVITSLLLCVYNCTQGNVASAIFLGYLSILTGYLLYIGYFSLRMKKEVTDRYVMVSKAFIAALFIGAVLMVLYGLTLPAGAYKSLMFIFASIGVLQVRSLFKSTTAIRAEYNWIIEHIRGMMISGIAAHTAFAAFGGRSLLGEWLSEGMMIIPWVVPTVIGVVIIKVMKRKYLRPRTLPVSAILATCVLLSSTASAQLYTEQQTRHRFAEMTIGIDLQQHLGIESSYVQSDDVRSLDIEGRVVPRVLIGGTHFWGHADFYVAFPLVSPSFSEGEQTVSILSGVETGFKYYPWRIESSKVRPYVGITLTDFYYRQTNGLLADGAGPEISKVSLPLVFGINYRKGQHMLELGAAYNYADIDYYIDRRTLVPTSLPRWWANVSYKYAFDTTLNAEQSWEDGSTAAYTEELAARGALDNFFVGVGFSSVWWLRKTGVSERAAPYLGRSLNNVMLDLALGYYWYKLDLDVDLSWRGYGQSMTAYDATETFQRRSLALEVKKYLVDYHGFVPFVGPIISHEWLEYEIVSNSRIQSQDSRLFAAGLVVGWDIRPNRIQWFTLRTNIRYFPSINAANRLSTESIPFDNVEFNFIQMVVYPGRL